MLENEGNWTEMCAFPKERLLFPAGRTWECQVKAKAVGVCGEAVSVPLRAHRLCSLALPEQVLCYTKNHKLKIFLLFLPFHLVFYLKTGQTVVTELLCLQSVTIPKKGAVSDYLNSAARQWPVEQHSSF